MLDAHGEFMDQEEIGCVRYVNSRVIKYIDHIDSEIKVNSTDFKIIGAVSIK